MKYYVPESKLKKIVFKYLDSWDWVNGLQKKLYEQGAWVFTKWGTEDEEFYENDSPFQMYEKNYFSNSNILPEDEWPLLVMGSEVQEEIEKIFGKDKIIKAMLLEWFNKTYNQEAKRI